jgi:transcription-repair coupling factor (superfamily II helicase)
MAFSSVVRALGRSPLTSELLSKLQQQGRVKLSGASRLPKGLVASTLAQESQAPMLVVTATLEEASRWAIQLEAMGWRTVHFYPTSEASPYEPFDQESEMTWGQLQALADLTSESGLEKTAIVATERALQPHLPPVEVLKDFCLTLTKGLEINLKDLALRLARLGYEKVPLVETEGQWAQRGDIIDVFPVSSELPLRVELFGDELERIREFDPANQRSLDAIDRLVLTPTDYVPLILDVLKQKNLLDQIFPAESLEGLADGIFPEGVRRWLGLAFDSPASLLDYLPENTVIALDEPDQCQAHSDRWIEHVDEHWHEVREQAGSQGARGSEGQTPSLQPPSPPALLPKIHRPFTDALEEIALFPTVHLTEIAEALDNSLNLASRPIPAIPHQFGKLAETIRGERDRNFAIWLISAQPSRSVALLQEHDCPAQFIPNTRDYPAIEKLQGQHTPVALKYSGLAELEGFVLPTFRIAIVTDKEFFGQHSLATPGYVRKRRKATSKQVDPNKMKPGDFVVHRNHGIGRFLKLESLTVDNETREYLVIQYEDGLLRVAADQVGSLSRYRATTERAPTLNKMTGKAWEKTKGKARKAVQKVAVDLLKLYAQRAKLEGFRFPSIPPGSKNWRTPSPISPPPISSKRCRT